MLNPVPWPPTTKKTISIGNNLKRYLGLLYIFSRGLPTLSSGDGLKYQSIRPSSTRSDSLGGSSRRFYFVLRSCRRDRQPSEFSLARRPILLYSKDQQSGRHSIAA